MAALTTRQEARERVLKAVMAELDRVIPLDESRPLKGRTFREWEDQADQFDRTVTSTLLEERAALEASARVGQAGRCPLCGSERVYLEKKGPRKTEVQTTHGKVVVERQSCRCRSCGRTFSPQDRDWGLSAPTPALSPKAAERVAREAAVQPYDRAAQALHRDWGVDYDGKQIERWGMKLGQVLVDEQEREARDYERGVRPAGPANDPVLLVFGLDGGRVQGREKDPLTGSRWREDKVLSITSYLPGDGRKKAPKPLATTYLATMGDSRRFGRLARVEAERRGIRQAPQVVNISDGAGWIDSQHQEHFGRHQRIVDYYHAVEHLHEVARAVHPQAGAPRQELAKALETLLWQGQTAGLVKVLGAYATKLGPVQEGDAPDHPRRVAAQNLGYFTKHQQHMNYPEYRKRGWPIGSGVTEAGVKQFNKRVKGTEQFWNKDGVEPILALRALWLSQDGRWDHYWLWGRSSHAAA